MVKLLLLDLSSAYYRCGMYRDASGLQALKLSRSWLVSLSLVFGNRKSGEIYPLFTGAISELHHPCKPAAAEGSASADAFCSISHVDDHALIEIVWGNRLRKSFAALVFAAKVVAGHDSPAADKIAKNGFPSSVHKAIGGIWDLENPEVNWPRLKQQETLAVLESESFAPTVLEFPGHEVQQVHGDLNWCAQAAVLPLGGLYRLSAKFEEARLVTRLSGMVTSV